MVPEARERCFQVLLHCGGDVERVFEKHAGGLADFAAHLSRIRSLDAADKPIVLLCQTNPLALAVLKTRRALEDAVPKLARAVWVIHFDEEEDPFFVGAASMLGTLDRDAAEAPLWSAPDDWRFLVVSSKLRDLRILRDRLYELEAAELDDELDDVG